MFLQINEGTWIMKRKLHNLNETDRSKDLIYQPHVTYSENNMHYTFTCNVSSKLLLAVSLWHLVLYSCSCCC